MNHHTPMMKQYLKFKKEHTDKILFFRLGDFYEMFYDDAKIVAKELNLTLTSKEVGKNNPVPLAGIPVHAADSYLSKLLKKGYKIAICDQVEDPAQSKGLVKREITRIITPGTITETNILDEKNNNFFMSICMGENAYGFAYVDISTGEFYAGEYSGKASLAKIKDEFYRLQPSEILADKKTHQLLYKENGFSENCIPPEEGEQFFHPYPPSVKIISNKFSHIDQELLGQQYAIIAAAAALRYLTTLQKNYLSHINKITCCLDDSFMQLDNITIRNLELLVTIREGKKSGGLLEIIDFTDTAMGGRMLKNWLVKPLTKLEQIQDRQNVIQYLKENDDVLISVKKILQHIYDLERLTTRLTLGHISPRDLLALRNSLLKIPLLKQKLANGPKYLSSLICSFPDLQELVNLIDSAINEDAPLSLKEGNIIKAGYDQEIDRLREIKKKGKTWLLDLEQKERGKTGIKSLKVSFNKVFGYYIEVTKPNLPQVPDYYIRKQTLVNAERFITEELKNFENEIFGAQEKLYQLEYNIFEKIRKKAASYSAQLQQIANIIANIDCLCSLAMAALRYNYCQPYFNKEGLIKIKQGRHPVVEQTLQAERFIPNDLEMNNKNKIHIITGPNMAGKSTYCRSIALIVILAQMGSFVPAEQAELTVIHRVFARVGAMDDLSAGKSTFMVEMREIADILQSAQENSLLVLDEIGKGTSTYDGISLAQAIIEYIHDNIKAFTLFSTHYHELTELEKTKELIANYYVLVKEKKDEIVFLRKVSPGKTDKSYGINVARLAGLPEEIINRASFILQSLEKNRVNSKQAASLKQLSFLKENHNEDKEKALITKQEQQVLDELRSLNLLGTTPLESLNKLYQLQKKLL